MARYVEVHCKSNFSFLEGASHAHELVDRAKELGYHGLAVTDRDTLAGIVRAHTAAKDAELSFIVGCELNPAYAELARIRIGKAENPATFVDPRAKDAPLFTEAP